MTGSRLIALAALVAAGLTAGPSAEAQDQAPAQQAQVPAQAQAPVQTEAPVQAPVQPQMQYQPRERVVEVRAQLERPPKVGPRLWEVTVGVRTVFIKDPQFDPFSNKDDLEQFSLSAARVLMRDDQMALVAGLILDVGATDASARGEPSELSLTRLSASFEGRYQPWSRLFGFLRIAPGVLHGSASLTDASSPTGSSLNMTFDAFSLDASAGAAFRFGAIGDSKISAWLIGDGGYGWVESERLLLAPSLGADQSKAGTVDLGTLSAGGGFFRIALALVY
jgi:hypothetical protein